MLFYAYIPVKASCSSLRICFFNTNESYWKIITGVSMPGYSFYYHKRVKMFSTIKAELDDNLFG